VPFLNFHHVRYFRIIAGEGSLTRAAEKLHLSPPALSIQLRQLEESLGHALFERTGGGLVLTEAGRVALDYAETIGRAGEELQAVMAEQMPAGRTRLRVGAVSTLSRNFQLEFVQPVLARPDVELILRAGGWRELLVLLRSHQVDVVLANEPVRRDAETPWHSHLLAEQPVSLVGVPAWRKQRRRFPEDFAGVPLILPGGESALRAEFDRLMAAAGVRPLVLAEVDDMAMLRLLAREGAGLALVPPVVVRDEVESRVLVETHRLPELRETFYAITPTRRFPNRLVGELVARMAPARRRGK
jgi:LysR family transcriptional activator of nhaA